MTEMPETDAPAVDFDRLTPAQQRVLGNIAVGLDGAHPPKVLAALEQMGLIVGHNDTMRFSDGLPPMTVKRWEVPLPVHMQWCDWCSNQFNKEGEDA